MEAVAPRLQISTWMVDSDKVARRRPKSTSAAFSRRLRDQNTTQVLVAAAAAHLPTSQVSNRKRRVALEVSCSYNNFPSNLFNPFNAVQFNSIQFNIYIYIGFLVVFNRDL